MLVAVGDNGTVLTSENGINWTVRSSGTIRRLSGAAFGGSRFVVVGDAGVIRTSQDGGETWQARVSGTTSDLRGLAHGSAGFVAVGEDGRIVTSESGVSWTAQEAVTMSSLNDIIFSDGSYTAVGGRWNVHGRARILTSADGASWSVEELAIPTILYGVGFGEGILVAAGAGGTIVSYNDDAWEESASPVTETLSGVAYGAGHFVAVGRNGTIARSTTDHYGSWLTERFSSGEIGEGVVTSPDVDPDGVGIANLVRYALGIDDAVADRKRLPAAATTVMDDGHAYLVLRYIRPGEKDDLLYRVEASRNLIEWEDIVEIGGSFEVESAGDFEIVTARDGVPTGADDRRFLRLRLVLVQ